MAVKRNWVGAFQRTFRVRRSSDSAQKSCSMGIGTNLVEVVRRKFSKSPPHKPIIVFNHTNNSDSFTNEEMEEEEDEEKEQANEERTIEYPKEFDAASGDDGDDEGYANASASFSSSEDLSFKEDLAAIIIQTFFRGHLARRAYRALRSLVRLQAVVRGAQVRSQARIALNCMRALVRLQRRIRDRQFLSRSSSELS